jgi:hypothetical protein
VPLPRNPALEHAAKAGETPQSYTNGGAAHSHTAPEKKADPTLSKGPEDANSGEYGMREGGGGDTNQSADSSSSTNTDTSSGDGSIASGTGSQGGNYLSNLLPRSTDPRGGMMMPDYGGGYNSPGSYGYPGYGVPSQYRPREYLPPLGANAYVPQGAPQQGQQLQQEDRPEKPVKKKKKPKGKE